MPTTAFSARENPFRVERVLTVRFRPLETSWDELRRRLLALGDRAAICGPEGSGKTTLLEDLAHQLSSAGRRARWLQLRRETRPLAHRQLDRFLAAVSADELLLVD